MKPDFFGSIVIKAAGFIVYFSSGLLQRQNSHENTMQRIVLSGDDLF